MAGGARWGWLTLWLWALLAHAETTPRLALLIDDLGYNLERGRQALALPGPISVAVLPFTPHAQRLAAEADAAGLDVLIHQPMAGKGPGPTSAGELHAAMDEASFRAQVRDAIASLPQASGLNNHQGSSLTSDAQAMTWLMQELAAQGLFFLDSRTSPASVALRTARQQALPALGRDVFLDHVPEPAAMQRQLNHALAVAGRQGKAVLIAHPYPETLAFLQQALPELLAQGQVELVGLQALLMPMPTAFSDDVAVSSEQAAALSEHTLGGRGGADSAGIQAHCHAQGTTEGLENGFCLMVGVHTPQVVDVQRHLRVIDETLKEFTQQVHIKPPNQRPGVVHLVHQPGPTGKIDHHP